jgi:metal-responsive CopG/Arc/MetJ family transcriptional regulator
MESEAQTMIRERLSLTLPKECMQWLDKQVEARKYFSRSHAMEVLILEAMKNEKKE